MASGPCPANGARSAIEQFVVVAFHVSNEGYKMEKKKALALAKVGLGGARMLSGAMTCLGHGLLAGYCRSHHLGQTAQFLGRQSFKGGMEMFRDGMRELEQ